MQSEATITFTQPGVQPPVYVVTSLSTPPWAPLELKPSKDKTPSGDYVFEQKFGNVEDGSYQYKIRIGEGHWVVDETKESATDELGNRNNVVHVKPAESRTPLDRVTNVKDALDRKDSTMDTADLADLAPGPIPFVVVEKVEDKDQPEYGDVEPKTLSVDESKRAADPDPDFEKTYKDSPSDAESHNPSPIPLVMVEKIDDESAQGDDFDADATNSQKVAQKSGSADTLPEEHGALEPADVQAPLFRHESFQDSEDSLPEASRDTIEEESYQDSTDQTSSGDIVNTPSAESQDDFQEDELSHGPLLPHETGLRTTEDDESDEFTRGPLLSHETGFTLEDARGDSDYEEDEYDAAPLLPHETGFSSYRSSEAASEGSRLTKDEYDYEPEHYMRYDDHSDDEAAHGELDLAPTFSHEQDQLTDDYGAPLLPHEQIPAAESFSGSERSYSMSPTTYESAYPAYGQEIGTAKETFGGSLRPSFFRKRTSNSTLPDKLPQTDAEDVNLHDPGLEVFPVGREQILERVATIGHKLPEDETHEVPTSPQSSVFSQACSSVDLVPVKSYLSLASVREDEEEDEEDADVESVGSPMMMNSSARFAPDRDPLATPHPDDSKQLGFAPSSEPDTQSTHTAESRDAGIVSISDGLKDKLKGLTSLSDIVTSRATVMNTLTPPLTPRAPGALSSKDQASEPELRQRREPASEVTESSVPTPRPEASQGEALPVTAPPMVAEAVAKLKPEKSSLQSWKGVGIGASALVAAGAAYYLALR